MDDEELEARLAGFRIALAFALKATCRSPAEFQSRVAGLKDVAGLVPPSLHAGVKDELHAVIEAMERLPVRDPHIHPHAGAVPAPQLPDSHPHHVPAPPGEDGGLLGELL